MTSGRGPEAGEREWEEKRAAGGLPLSGASDGKPLWQETPPTSAPCGSVKSRVVACYLLFLTLRGRLGPCELVPRGPGPSC